MTEQTRPAWVEGLPRYLKVDLPDHGEFVKLADLVAACPSLETLTQDVTNLHASQDGHQYFIDTAHAIAAGFEDCRAQVLALVAACPSPSEVEQDLPHVLDMDELRELAGLPSLWRSRMGVGWRGHAVDRAFRMCAEELETQLARVAACPPPEEPLSEQLGSALADLQQSPDCWCGGVNRHTIGCQQAKAAQKRWMAERAALPPAGPARDVPRGNQHPQFDADVEDKS